MITPQYNVNLELFEGPLDLLLYLIKKNDMDIHDIRISQITAEYLGYIDIMKQINLDIASEFLVMAATLMQIKAHMLLPRKTSESSEEEIDPQADLIAKLVEYQKYKGVSQILSGKEVHEQGVYYKDYPVFTDDEFVLDANVFDLIDTFRKIITELPKETKEVLYEEIPVERKIREILDFLDSQESPEGKKFANFEDMLLRETTRMGIIVAFLALLELIRLKQIVARQATIFGKIRIYRIDGN